MPRLNEMKKDNQPVFVKIFYRHTYIIIVLVYFSSVKPHKQDNKNTATIINLFIVVAYKGVNTTHVY